MGAYVVAFSKGPNQLAIHNDMLIRQRGYGLGPQSTCMGGMAQTGFISIKSPPNEKAISDIGQGWLAG